MDLEQINRERKKKGKREMSEREAKKCLSYKPAGEDSNMWLMGYILGSSDPSYDRDPSFDNPHHGHHDTGTSSDTGSSGDGGSTE